MPAARTEPGILLPYTPQDRRLARLIADVIHAQHWRKLNTETTWLSPYEANVWGTLAEMALARHLGLDYRNALRGSEPWADLTSPSGLLRYEVRSTPWLSRKAWESGQWRTFVYPREVATPRLVIARVDTFLAGGSIWLTGWMLASEAAQWPLDPGQHLTRHAVPGPGPLSPPETLPREVEEWPP
jgi:hypothetical protein